MPFDVRGRTRATMRVAACCFPSSRELGNHRKLLHAWDWGLQLFPLNEESLVSTSHQLVLNMSLPLVHIARRHFRLSELVRTPDSLVQWPSVAGRVKKMSELDHLEDMKVVTKFP